ncbi:MAG: response regulator transcription factor [Methylophilaceae bacterium]
MTIKLIIADDEAPARNRLRDLLSEISDVLVTAEAKNGQELLDLAVSQQPDIVLLDIRMPMMDGVEAAQHLQKMVTPPVIIFTTAYDDYALQAFDLNAVDYLLKPIRLERLQTALSKARALQPKQLDAIATLNPKRAYLSINERGRIILISIADIIYLRAELKYITVRTAEKEYLLDESLNNLEQEFATIFIRLHRNCLVAQAYITGYEKRALSHDAEGNINTEKQWVALLKNIPDIVPVSRRQQHLIRHH